jgi:serine/threonine protein phosphatase 1
MDISREVFVLPRGPEPGVEVFAFGDVHGRSDLLAALLDVAAAEPRRAERRLVVFLGDLVDRGPDSLGAIRLARAAGARLQSAETLGLMGNHEAMMRMAFDPQTPEPRALDAFANWLRNGGRRVIAEFVEPAHQIGYVDEVLEATRRALPDDIYAWLGALKSHGRSGGLLFVHAGVRPGRPLEAFLAAPWNTPLDRLDEDAHWAWMRRPFLEHRPGPQGFSGYFVVHGHTPNDGRRFADHPAQINRFRLNLDGGSGFTGACKMGIFRGNEVEVVTARGEPNERL